jgi:inner membrane protein YidH
MDTSRLKADELDPSMKLSIHNTELALDNSLMSADGTQMSIVRTSLALIGFGFTIFKFFQDVGKEAARSGAFGSPARNLGVFLVLLGMLLLMAGLLDRYRFVRALDRRRQILYDEGLLWAPHARKSTSPNMVASVLLLLVGVLVLLGITVRLGPFG